MGEEMMERALDHELAVRLERVEMESHVSMFEDTGSDIEKGVETRRIGGALLRIDRSEGGWNRVNGLGVSELATPEIVDSMVELYRASGVQSFAVNLSPAASPAELTSWLTQRGFSHLGNAAKIYRGVQEPNRITTDLRIEEARWATVADLARVLEDGFGMTPGRGAVVAAAAEKPGWRWFVAYDGTQPVAAGGLSVWRGAGWLGYGATVPSHRKRGAQGAIIARRIAAAAELGCEWVTSETVEDRPEAPVSSYHNMIRNGFELLYLRPIYEYRFA
jgi:GNAT superfamily N-acetyltransferase